MTGFKILRQLHKYFFLNIKLSINIIIFKIYDLIWNSSSVKVSSLNKNAVLNLVRVSDCQMFLGNCSKVLAQTPRPTLIRLLSYSCNPNVVSGLCCACSSN